MTSRPVVTCRILIVSPFLGQRIEVTYVWRSSCARLINRIIVRRMEGYWFEERASLGILIIFSLPTFGEHEEINI